MSKEFKPLAMLELRRNPGLVIDRMRFHGERFVLTRRDKAVAYLIPVTNAFAPASDGVDAAVVVDPDGRFRLQR